jgi:hypothetical protein
MAGVSDSMALWFFPCRFDPAGAAIDVLQGFFKPVPPSVWQPNIQDDAVERDDRGYGMIFPKPRSS